MMTGGDGDDGVDLVLVWILTVGILVSVFVVASWGRDE